MFLYSTVQKTVFNSSKRKLYTGKLSGGASLFELTWSTDSLSFKTTFSVSSSMVSNNNLLSSKYRSRIFVQGNIRGLQTLWIDEAKMLKFSNFSGRTKRPLPKTSGCMSLMKTPVDFFKDHEITRECRFLRLVPGDAKFCGRKQPKIEWIDDARNCLDIQKSVFKITSWISFFEVLFNHWSFVEHHSATIFCETFSASKISGTTILRKWKSFPFILGINSFVFFIYWLLLVQKMSTKKFCTLKIAWLPNKAFFSLQRKVDGWS